MTVDSSKLLTMGYDPKLSPPKLVLSPGFDEADGWTFEDAK
ncbi:hypothetical protein [Streptomyces coryli]|nr:hypothetical protein [Streptomyces coryli]